MEDGERGPLILHDDDDDDANTTQPFDPGAASTSKPSGVSHRMTTMNKHSKRGPRTAETSLLRGHLQNEFGPQKL